MQLDCKSPPGCYSFDEAPSTQSKLADTAMGLSVGVPRLRYTANRLSSAVCDRIHPAVASYVQVFPVIVDRRDGEDLLAFVIEVRQGITAYQASDKRYYGRRSFSSEPLEDKEIRLGMLADEMPRASVLLDVEAFPAGFSWESWDRSVQSYAQARAKWRSDKQGAIK